MTEMKDMPVKGALKRKVKTEDLSNAVAQAVERMAGEKVRCTRLWGDHYRCNWWASDGDDAIGSVIGRIVRTRFLRATRTPDGLMIEDLTG